MPAAFSRNGGPLAVLSRRIPADTSSAGQAAADRKLDGQRASIAQLLLLACLRARNRRDLTVELLERAVQVMRVTCKSWLLPSRERGAADQAPQSAPLPILPALHQQDPQPKTTPRP